ncbi:MAG: hypothetical protein QNL62_04250 [Gammaproteobacteria bacterium]|nr:hypothetical protein [Gammaproteobacteria bacterium]
MDINTLMEQIKKVQQGQGDFSSLLDDIHRQTISHKKVVSLAAVKRARQFNRCINPPVVE